MRLFLILIFIYGGLTRPVLAESYSYPFSVDVTIQTIPGRSILEVVEAFYRGMRTDEFIQDANVRHHNRALVRIDDNEFASVRCSVKRQYKGPLGKVLFELLSDYGCGYQIEEGKKPEGPSYVLTLRRADPSKVFSIVVPPPEDWREEIAKHRGTFEVYLRSKGVRVEGLRSLDSYHFPRSIQATGSYACVQSIWHRTIGSQHHNNKGTPSGDD